MEQLVGREAADTTRTPETVESIRLQAEEHPLIDGGPSTSINQHVGRLMHVKAYEVAADLAYGLDILDVGCNTGYGTILLAAAGRRVVGVDVSPRAIEAATAAAPGGRPEFLAIDGVALPFPDGSFDVVTSFQVIEHVLEPTPYLREIARVLRPGGTLVLTTPNAATRLDPGMTPWNPFHVREYPASELEAELRRVFPSVHVQGMFAASIVYEAELARVDAARRRIRARDIAAAARSAHRGAARRPLSIRIARRLLPAAVRAQIRRVRAGAGPARSQPASVGSAASPASPPAAPVVDLQTFLRFTTADLFYAETDLDRSMDFMAICRLARRSSDFAERPSRAEVARRVVE